MAHRWTKEKFKVYVLLYMSTKQLYRNRRTRGTNRRKTRNLGNNAVRNFLVKIRKFKIQQCLF